MTHQLLIRNAAQSLYNRALTSAWRNKVQIYDPSVWQMRDPEVEEKMLRDADIAHAVGYRRAAIAGRTFSLIPRDEGNPAHALSVLIGTNLVKRIPKFTEVRSKLARAFFSGARFARIHGRHETLDLGDGRPRKWWVPTRIEDIDKRRYRISPDYDPGGENLSAIWERWDVGKGDWVPEMMRDAVRTIRHVYQEEEAAPYGSALRESLGWWWYAKTHVLQESLSAIERFAQGIIHARVEGVRDAASGRPNHALIAEWQAVLEDLMARNVLVSDAEDNVEMIHASGEGWQILTDMRQELRSTIFTLVMAANLPTTADEGGSYALAEVQENSTEMLIQNDRESLEETLTDDLLSCLWFENFANFRDLDIHRPSDIPLMSLRQEKRRDPLVSVQAAQALHTMGVDLSLVDVLDQAGFDKPEDGEDIIRGGSMSGGGFDLGAGMPLAPDAPLYDTAEPADAQATALNGAQVTAAAEIVDRVTTGAMPGETAVIMLVAMFDLPEDKARKMIRHAEKFQPATSPDEAIA